MSVTEQGRAVERVLAAVDALADEVVATLTAAIRIPSITPRYPGEDYATHVGREGEVARLVAGVYRRAGCEVDLFGLEPGRENAVGVRRGRVGGRSLLYNGHVDVVPPGPAETWTGGDPFSGRVESGRVHGRGACDMKAGVVAQAFAALALHQAGIELDGDLILEAVVGEEMMEHGLGTTACVERGHRADAAVVAEPSAPPAPLGVVPATPGIQRFLVHVEGRAGHPGMRGESVNAGGAGWRAGVNAIDRGVQIHAALRQLEQEWALSKTHPLFKPGQFAIHPGVFVGSPKGRLEPFVVADSATLDYIAIHHPEETPEQVRAEIERQIAAACALDGWLREHPARIEWVHAWPQSVVDASHPIVTATAEAHRAALGREAVVHGWTAVHDGTYLNLAGIPAISYGPGDVRDAHTTDESVSVDELLDATRTFAVLALQWCGATTRSPDTTP